VLLIEPTAAAAASLRLTVSYGTKMLFAVCLPDQQQQQQQQAN